MRERFYVDLSDEYGDFQKKLDDWSNRSVKRTSKDFYKLAGEDLAILDGVKVNSFATFSVKHLEEYFERIHPFNADKLAAANVHLNPQVGKMLDSDVRALRAAVVDVFREASVSAMTADERYRALRDRMLTIGEKPKSWAFIDKSGRKWKPNNYFEMLNRTISANVARDTYDDALVSEGRDLVQIIGGISANSNPACVAWVGRVVSISGTSKDYPPLDDYISEGGFHPNCVHTTRYMSDEFPPQEKILEAQKDKPAPDVNNPKPKAKQAVGEAEKDIRQAANNPTP